MTASDLARVLALLREHGEVDAVRQLTKANRQQATALRNHHYTATGLGSRTLARELANYHRTLWQQPQIRDASRNPHAGTQEVRRRLWEALQLDDRLLRRRTLLDILGR